MANTAPVAGGVAATTFEDGLVSITLTASDNEDGSQLAPSFSFAALPEHGTLYVEAPFPPFFDGVPAQAGASYAADSFDPDSGAWTRTFYFVPAANWNGTVAFDYTATDSEGAVSASATATVIIEAMADAPTVDPNAHDQPAPLAVALQATATSTAEDSPQVVALDGGGFLMVWQTGLSTGQILARQFGDDGTPSGAAFAITPSGSPSEVRPAVAALDGGGFVVAWIQGGTGTGGGDILASIFAAGQTNATATLTVAASASGREATPNVTALDDGFVITRAVEDGASTTILAQRYDAAGATVGSAATVTTAADHGFSSGTMFDPPDHVVTALADGGFAVSWSEGGAIRANVFHADGSRSGAFTVADAGSNPTITALGDGFVVAWVTDELYARVYGADGQPAGAAFTLTDNPYADEQTPTIAALPDGRFVVAWRGNNGTDGSADIFAAVYLPDGTPNNGGPIQITSTGTASNGFGTIWEAQPTITVLADGDFAVGWIQPFATGGSNADVFVRVYDPGLGTVTGTEDQPLELPTAFVLADQDGSEALGQVRIVGLPLGFSISDGSIVVGAREGGDPAGDWVIDATDATFLAQLAAGIGHLTLIPPQDFVGDFRLTITAVSRETQAPIEASSLEATSSAILVPVSFGARVNDAPVANDDVLANVTQNSGTRTIAAADLLLNDTDPDNVSGPANAGLTITSVASGTGGTAVLSGDHGTISFTPTSGYSGPASFAYVASDGSATDEGLVTFTIDPAPPPTNPNPGGNEIFGDEGPNTIAASAGDSVVRGFGGGDLLYGNAGNDTVHAGSGSNTVYGGRDNDRIDAGDGDDLLFGNEGGDVIDGGEGNNTIVGGQDSADAADSITAGGGQDLIWGNGGNDTVNADGGANTVIGGFGTDSLVTGAGDDIVYGNQDNDIIQAGDGANLVLGGLGEDLVATGTGNDTMWGNEGNDTMIGGAGADRYVFATDSGADQVNGFSFIEGDRLDLQGQTFGLGTSADGDVVLTLSGGGTIELNGVAPAGFAPAFVV
jgi:Ca2+-binding RTX toxin-like protein